MELVSDAPLQEIECPSCGSSFSLVGSASTAPLYCHEPRTLGHFQLIDQVGIGRFGSVWKAKDTELDRSVAVKIPRNSQLDSDEMEVFFREARAAAQLKHGSIVSVHEVGREDDTIYIVSDLVDGASLREWLSGQRLSAREAAELCIKLAEALHYAHEQGVVHRDLKPSNIMMDLDGEPHIMDFGLAKRESGEITMTLEGQILGTPAYMPPEQARGEGHQVDRRADVYALGVILFELLTGELPFRGDTRMLIVQILREEPPGPRKLNSGVSRDLETICLKCLRKEPDRRYGTAAELSADLQRWLNGEPIKARPVSRIEKLCLWCRRRPTVAGSIAAILLTACIVTGIILVERRRSLAIQVQTAAASLHSNRGIIQPSFRELDRLPPEMLLRELREQIATADEDRQLAMAFTLAHFGEIRLDFIVSQIQTASPDEFENFVVALQGASAEAVPELTDAARAAESQENWQLKARLSMLALYLNAPTLARDMCLLRPDPIQRTWFIEECSTWHGHLTELARIAGNSDDPHLRSAVVLVAGSVPEAVATAADKQAWEPLLASWYRNESDTLIHSAASWTLRNWNLELPELAESPQLLDGRHWCVNSVGMTQLTMPAGSFVRRDSNPDEAATEQHVTITRSFLMADREVTRAQFQQFIADPDYPTAEKPEDWQGSSEDYSPTELHPVQQVSWYDAIQFCNWLSLREGLIPCYERTGETEEFRNETFPAWRLIPESNCYRLPTEAEWEYACRAGTITEFSHGDDEALLDRYAVVGSSRTELPGSKLPNPWGLFDIHGSLFEWCQDWYGPFGNEAAVSDPMGPAHGDGRVLRGGSFDASVRFARSAFRSYNPVFSYHYLGFRVARNYP